MRMLLNTAASAVALEGSRAMGCRTEKLGSIRNTDFASVMSVSLLQSEVSLFRTERLEKHQQGAYKSIDFKEKRVSVQSTDFLSIVPVSLLQSEVSAVRTMHVEKHRQGDLPSILNKAAQITSTPLPSLDGSPTTQLPVATKLPVPTIPIIRHVKPPLLERMMAEANTTTDDSEGHADRAAEATHHQHHSIFKLQFSELDKEVFWLILLGMLVFTILLDRLEFFAAKKAENNMARQMYLNRLNAELMMFGVVATVVFINEQFWEPTAETAVLFEFVVVFCSMGACGLFISGLVLFILHHWMERRWRFFGGRQQGSHMRESQRMQCEEAAANKLLEGVLNAKSIREVDVQHCVYCIMSARFKRAHSLPDSFDYSEYLKLCLTDSICDLMNINWISWLAVLAFTLLLYGFHLLHPEPYTPKGYFIIFASGVWSLSIIHLLVLVIVLQAQMHLTRGLGCNSLPSLQESLRQAVKSRMELSVQPVQRLHAKLVSALEQVIQLVGLATSFQGAYLVMHVLHNVVNVWWRLAVVAPIVIDCIVLLPLIISYFTVIKAYYSPEHAIVDSTLEWSAKLEEDLRFVAKQLQVGEQFLKFRNTLNVNSKEQFLQSHSDVGLHVSPQRAFRIYGSFASNAGSGKVDRNLVIDAYVEQNPALGGKSSILQSGASLIRDSLVGRSAWGGLGAPASGSQVQDHYDGLRGLAVPTQTIPPAGKGYNTIY